MKIGSILIPPTTANFDVTRTDWPHKDTARPEQHSLDPRDECHDAAWGHSRMERT